MKFNDAVFGAVLLLLGLAVLVHVPSFPTIPGQKVGPALFPGLIAVGLVVCALMLIVNGIRHRATEPWIDTGDWMRSRRHIGAFFVTIGVVVAYIALADKIGFLIVGPLVLLALFLATACGRSRPSSSR
jgi:putative tricarboxylic transport membrane protein